MAVQVIQATIAAGESESAAIDCSGNLMKLRMPADWTPAVLSFAVSYDGTAFADLFDYVGEEITINVIPGTVVIVPEAWARSLQFLKIRSGTRGQPVTQELERIFELIADRTPASAKRPLPASSR